MKLGKIIRLSICIILPYVSSLTFATEIRLVDLCKTIFSDFTFNDIKHVALSSNNITDFKARLGIKKSESSEGTNRLYYTFRGINELSNEENWYRIRGGATDLSAFDVPFFAHVIYGHLVSLESLNSVNVPKNFWCYKIDSKSLSLFFYEFIRELSYLFRNSNIIYENAIIEQSSSTNNKFNISFYINGRYSSAFRDFSPIVSLNTRCIAGHCPEGIIPGVKTAMYNDILEKIDVMIQGKESSCCVYFPVNKIDLIEKYISESNTGTITGDKAVHKDFYQVPLLAIKEMCG